MKKYSRAMAEKLSKSVLQAYNRAEIGDLAPIFDAAEKHILEIIADTRMIVAGGMEEAFASVADLEVEA